MFSLLNRKEMGLLSKTGAAMSTKQLIATVKDGRPLTFYLGGGIIGQEPGPVTVEGFLAGIDDFHWLVYQEPLDGVDQGRILLLHKGNVVAVEIGRESTYKPTDDSEKVIAPFRRWVESRYRGEKGDDDAD